jgi:hypothetical protein
MRIRRATFPDRVETQTGQIRQDIYPARCEPYLHHGPGNFQIHQFQAERGRLCADVDGRGCAVILRNA